MGPILKNFVLIFALFILSIVTAKAQDYTDADVNYDDQAEDRSLSNYRAPALDADDALNYAMHDGQDIKPMDDQDNQGEDIDALPEEKE